jgi:hypothetical protein
MRRAKRLGALQPSEQILHTIGQELKDNPPDILAHTRARFGARRDTKQKTAILLSKARKAGAHIPEPK